MTLSRRRRFKCLSCNSYVIFWGKTRYGNKRLRCLTCGITSVMKVKNTSSKKERYRDLFKQYVLNGITLEILSQYSGYSIFHLQRIISKELQLTPPDIDISIQDNQNFPCLLIDGLWFGRFFVLMVYRRSKELTLLHVSTAGREVSTKISRDLMYLKEKGFVFKGIVSDGGTGIVSAVHEVYRFTVHQICLAHMHRQIVSSIGKRSRDVRIQELRSLADHVWKIESKEALKWWIKKVRCWENTFREFIEEYRYDDTNRGWYVHKGVRKALRIMKKIPWTSFKFLTYPLIPKTTNEIEASFGHLYKRWIIHRGMKKTKWKNFLKWFVYFYNEKILSSKKTRADNYTNTK